MTLGGSTNEGSTYHAVHIRRGDFQYSHTRLSAERIWENISPLLNSSRTPVLYVATDEKVEQCNLLLFMFYHPTIHPIITEQVFLWAIQAELHPQIYWSESYFVVLLNVLCVVHCLCLDLLKTKRAKHAMFGSQYYSPLVLLTILLPRRMRGDRISKSQVNWVTDSWTRTTSAWSNRLVSSHACRNIFEDSLSPCRIYLV